MVRSAWAVFAANEELRDAATYLDEQLGQLDEVGRRVQERTRFRDWLFRRTGPELKAAIKKDRLRVAERVWELEQGGAVDVKKMLSRLALPTPAVLEADFRSRYADYAALFEKALSAQGQTAGLLTSQGPTTRGPYRGLPTDLARRIESFPLDVRGLRVTLRKYQEFGAKYMLVQGRTLLGDEMGLGKTIQALAAFAHLDNSGSTHFLVICPASITSNWQREVRERQRKDPLLLHGGARLSATARWIENGGVAITSYGTLSALGLPPRLRASNRQIDLCVVDEAHFAKNPGALRSRAVREIARCSERLCLMTGTPLENRLEEFRSIVAIASPDLARKIPDEAIGFARVSDLVAPVYLRRNQRDVLAELPEKIVKQEWVELYGSDRAAYHLAARQRNYMAMRRAVVIGHGTNGRSAKLDRLAELLAEYEALGRKVLVYSFFRDVISVVAARFPAMGVLHGGIPPNVRQEIIDEYSALDGYALLVSQIQAGGVGLNLQAASVVVLTEPQWKPSTENQAIARAHRMGQTEHVVVHRLLAVDCVDERLVEYLERKQALFDQHVLGSALKEASSEATGTEQTFAKWLIDAELAKLGGRG